MRNACALALVVLSEMTPATHLGRVARDRLWLILATAAVAALAAFALVSHASRTYEAQAQILISPVAGDGTLAGLGLLRESSDPTRDVETASRLVTTAGVAALVARRLALRQSPQSLLGQVRAEPVAQSDLVAVTGSAHDPRRAQALANAFARAAIDVRGEQFDQRIGERIGRLQAQGAGNAAAGTPQGADMATLQALRGGGDPTLQLGTPATAPSSPVSPRPALTVIAALLGGLVLGLGAALALERFAPRLRRESQIRERYGLAVLARIPAGPPGDTAIGPGDLSGPGRDAYRTLQATLTASRIGRRAVFVTAAGHGEGVTSTALNLSVEMAQAGQRVLLIEANLRQPALGGVLGITPAFGLVEVLLGEVPLRDAVISAPGSGGRLLVLAASGRVGHDPRAADYLSLPSAGRLLVPAKSLAPRVVIDGPPLLAAREGSALATAADELLIVARVGHSRLDALDRLQARIEHDGSDVVGVAAIAAPRRWRNAVAGAAGWVQNHPLHLPGAGGGLAPDRTRDPAA